MSTRRTVGAIAAAAAALGIAACGSSTYASTPENTSNSAATATAARAHASGAKTLLGAGSTLVAPLISVWQPKYDKQDGVAVTYGAVGSGGGIEQITARTVNFGASDAPLTHSQAVACKGCLEIPWALSATAIAYHVQGVPNKLRFTGPVLADIWMGKIKSWNSPAIRKLNPGVKLPNTPIQPVHRTDGSGDTFAFTNYLSKASSQFKSKIGNATTVNWPGGLGGKGNSGVGGVLSATNGAIAYIAIAYVRENKFDFGLVQNSAGRYPTPNVGSIAAAARALKSVPRGARQGISLTDPPKSARNAYPISTFTYVLVRDSGSAAPVATALRQFIGWAVTTGQADGPALDFAPLPQSVVSAAQADVKLIK